MIGKNISRYRILGQVGEGGMGVVYVAEDTVLGRRVAVKIPHAGKDESHYRARFLREARAVSKLRHENIAAVHDYGETEEGQPFIVMELVSGQTLGDLLSGPGISVARAVEVACQVARALSEAHRMGVVHRDIKPSNVVIDDAGTVKVLDFGLAKQLHEESGNGANGAEAQTLLTARTRSDVVIGTPLYLSPEQARGAKVDGRSDLFALGALLYECLTGRPAFSGANVIEIGAQVLHFDPPPPSRLNSRVPPELDRLTLKALAKKPEDRFRTADEMASELARVRSRLPASDTVQTRRLAGADNGHRSSALITMAAELRRPKFSPLTLLASLAGLALVIWAVWYVRQPSAHRPAPDVARLYEQGVDAMREGSYYKASGLLRQAVERDEKFALAHARLAEALLEMDFLDRAKDSMLNVTTLTPDFSVYPRPDALYLEAVRSTLRQDYEGAVKSYEEIVGLDPRRPQSHLDLGRAYERNNQTQKALASYTEATTLDNSYAAAFLRLGTLHVRQVNQAGAVAAFDSAQKLYAERGNREGEAAVRYQRGRLFLGLQKAGDARDEFERALQIARESDNKYQEVQTLLQLAQAIPDGADAEKTALQAIDLAQATGMNDQLANGHLTLGNVYLIKLNSREQAEQHYNQALQIASNYKLRRYEALASFNLGSLRERQGKFDEADELAERARVFFLPAGYRKEADQCAMLAARSKKGRGDHEGALKIFQELLRTAEQSSDWGQAGNLHRECGIVLSAQGKYPQALKHYEDSASYAKTMRNQSLLSHSLLHQANAHWALGHYEEAGRLFGQLTGADPQTLGVTKDFPAYVQNAQAEMELSRRHYREAAELAGRALATLKEWNGQSENLRAAITNNLGLAEALGGAPARGRALCEEAVRIASVRNDPATVAFANFALAQVLLEAGDAAGARDAALRAQEGFARAGRADFEWRALAVAGRASRRLADGSAAHEYLSRAEASLTQFQQSLGAETAGYLSRPDVQWLRGEFGASTASAAH
ncbi:MAG TPA: protein kinase [Pyrinomonadaceae bacterium]|jgi:tetratricopeptide (TPR) repeat protein/tRNA A-37 threonylcarbamoyl transferase component Bud32